MNIIDVNPKNHARFSYRKSGGADSRILIGLLFVLIGVVLIAENFDFIPYDLSHVLISWPMLLICIGFFNIARKAYTPGVIILGIGTYFLLPRIFDLPDGFFRNFWPIMLIIVGLVFILQWKRSPVAENEERVGTDTDKNDFIDETAIFGGRNMSLVSENFKGGKITSIFGGSKINLLYCKPAPGCVIDVANIFGGSKIIVPEEWNVKSEVVSIFGGFEDKRSSSVISRIDQTKIVVIKGVTIFGGGEITTMP